MFIDMPYFININIEMHNGMRKILLCVVHLKYSVV
jgi:hypothetical protein